ncbi:heat shock 70 kDa cognate 1, partial [Brachionus plicatilis]
ISAMVLRELKKIAETHLGEKVKAVITVPAYFNDEQKQATLDAAKIAGLEVLKIIPEPTAAAIAYGFHRKLKKKSKILIFDLGGGTFDVSIMEIDDGEFRVLGVDGDIHLGGTDFDNRLVDHFLQIVKDKYHVDLRDRKKATLRLKKKCEELKRELSLVNETNIEIDALIGEQDFECRFTRKKFEEINEDFFESTIEIVASALKSANLSKQDIDDVVLVGGSSRIPKVKKLLQSFFDGKQLRQDINPDEVVAFGAAIQARLLCGDSLDGRVRKIIDVIPKSLGIQLNDGSMDVFFPRNSSIPNKFTKIYTNCIDNQLKALFLIFEGEDRVAANNNLLGEFTLENIKSCPKHMAKFDTIFKIDENGLLSVTAKDLDTLSSNQISISFQKGSLSEVSISEMTNQMDKLFS